MRVNAKLKEQRRKKKYLRNELYLWQALENISFNDFINAANA